MTTRTYIQKKRAEQQAETRQRIVEAAMELHGTVGPARTTMTMIAERAGVQRNTLYAHFPDERSLLMACSGHSLEQDPPPDGQQWRAIRDPAARLQAALAAIYRWYARTCDLTGCVLRDAEIHPPTREIIEIRLSPVFAEYAAVLGEGLEAGQVPVLHLALSFHSWRSLVTEGGLTSDRAAEVMARAVFCAA